VRNLVRIHHRTKVLTTNQYDGGHSRENDIIHAQIGCAEEHLTGNFGLKPRRSRRLYLKLPDCLSQYISLRSSSWLAGIS
jgi:hypothetical protein